MRGSWLATGRKRMRSEMLTFCKSLLPVMTGTLRGQERQSKIMGFCTHGMRKGVPSPTTMSCTPRNRSKMTALCPESTLYKAEFTTPPATAKARPNLPMDSNTLAAMFPSVGPTHTCFHSDLHIGNVHFEILVLFHLTHTVDFSYFLFTERKTHT